ncbi:MAG: hypothetical protein HZC54_03090 [Verrucomicrobia bacterium]|nr:hypothetical protein [Verrucomicrobiota bacterium]
MLFVFTQPLVRILRRCVGMSKTNLGLIEAAPGFVELVEARKRLKESGISVPAAVTEYTEAKQ